MSTLGSVPTRASVLLTSSPNLESVDCGSSFSLLKLMPVKCPMRWQTCWLCNTHLSGFASALLLDQVFLVCETHQCDLLISTLTLCCNNNVKWQMLALTEIMRPQWMQSKLMLALIGSQVVSLMPEQHGVQSWMGQMTPLLFDHIISWHAG